MSKVMFVTVGTSLFHSASWENSEANLRDLPGCEQWTAGDALTNPEARKRSPAASRIQASLEKRLTLTTGSEWANRLAYDLTGGRPNNSTVMRYSAELATILKLFEKEAGRSGGLELREFLRTYDCIYLPCDTSGRDTAKLPSAAAYHLAAYLNFLAGSDGLLAQVLPVPGLSSKKHDDLLGETTGLGRLSKLIEDEKAAQQDFVISGGYKLYGVYLYPLLDAEDRSARILYIHEEGNELLEISRPAQENDRRSTRRRMLAVFKRR